MNNEVQRYRSNPSGDMIADGQGHYVTYNDYALATEDVLKGRKLDVLDHGLVRLVDYMGSDLSVVRNARVSYDAAWRAGEDVGRDERLINYLVSNGHNTPLEAVVFTFEVKLPVFVARQWIRHRTWSFNEVSARYTQLPNEMYEPKPEVIGTQSKHNKQMRDIGDSLEGATHSRAALIEGEISLHNDRAYQSYQRLLDTGAPRELARGVLPFNIYTHWFCTVNLHNLSRFLAERLHPHAQWEIQQYAKALLTLAEPVAPVAFAAYRKHVLDLSKGS